MRRGLRTLRGVVRADGRRRADATWRRGLPDVRPVVPRDGWSDHMMGKAFSRVAVLVLVAVGGAGIAIAAPAAAEEPAPEESTAKFEVDFLMDMIDHHAMAVEMAETWLVKAMSPDMWERLAGEKITK